MKVSVLFKQVSPFRLSRPIQDFIIKINLHALFFCIAGVPDKKQLRLEIIEGLPPNVCQQVSNVSIVCDGPPAKVHLV